MERDGSLIAFVSWMAAWLATIVLHGIYLGIARRRLKRWRSYLATQAAAIWPATFAACMAFMGERMGPLVSALVALPVSAMVALVLSIPPSYGVWREDRRLEEAQRRKREKEERSGGSVP